MPSPRATAILVASACLAIGSIAAPARAQVTAGALNDAVASLNSGDRDRVMAGRQSLLTLFNAARSNPPVLATFAAISAAALMPVAAGKDPHAKLNAAIVVQRVADGAGSTDLTEISAKLVADASPAVATYGLRAAAKVLPRVLANDKLAANNPITPAILSAVQAHPENEAVAFEAYGAIVALLNDRTAAETLTPAGVNAATPRAVDAVHKLLAIRIEQFGSGTLAEPAAEQPAISFLGRQNTWNLSTPEQRTQTTRLLLQLMQASAREMATVPASGGRLKLEALRNVVKGSAGSLSVMAQLANKPTLQTATQRAAQLGLATPVNDYKQVIDQIAADFARDMPELATTRPATSPAGANGAAPAGTAAPAAPGATPPAPAPR